ncbi:kinase-like protein, partial [Hesseltinella vesiculosa]
MMPSSHSATADSTCQHDQQRYSDHDKQTMLQAIDDLLSCTAASYFMQPLPQVDSAMDFTSLETNVLADKYSSWPSFEQDLGLIWSDPVKVLPPTSAVYKAALELKETYRSNSQSSSTANLQRVPASLKTADAIQLDTTLPVYVASIDPDSSKSSTAESTVYDRMHAPLLDYLEHSLDNPPTATTPSHRLFLKDDAATLRQHCIVHPWFYTAIVWKVSQASLSDSKFTVNVTVGRLLADHIHSMAADTNSPRSWVKFLPLTTHPRVQLDLSPAMAATFIHRRCKLTPVQPLHFQPKKDHVLIQTMKMALLGGFRASSTLPTPAVSQQSQYDDDLHLPDQQGKTVANSVAHENYSKMSQTVFSRIKKLAQSLAIPVCSEEKYHQQIQAHANAAGFFKQVWYVNHNAKLVVQAFQRMTASQRTTEIVSLLRLKSLPHMPKIVEVLHSKNDPNNLIGLSMERYERTLKHYMRPHTHSALTAHQKMDLIRQMLQCMETIHRVGIAHRDISEVNFMVNVKEGEPKLPDGSQAADLYLIDFGKAVFTTPDDLKQWWVAKDPTTPEPLDQYKGEVMPRNLKELNVWCAQLPWIHAKPDHGYCHYRSIQTLPRNRQDRAVLPWLVHPMAEDMYSVMTLIWKVFSDMEPWYGVLDTDLRELRDIVGDEFNMKRKFDKDVYGECSRELLSLCLKVKPEERATATQVLAWLDAPGHVDALIKE